MKRLMGILGWLGVVLVVAALILSWWKPELDLHRKLALAGLVVTVLYAASQWRDIGRSFQSRGAKYGSIAAGTVVVFIGILIVVNYIGNRNNKRWDLTESQAFSLQSQTRQLLSSLKSPLNVHVFYSSSQQSIRQYRDRFEEYRYISKNISVEYIDGEVDRAQAEKYEIVALPTVVLEYEGRTQRAQSADEQQIVNALKKLMEGKVKKAYFVQGHGEQDPDDASTPRGFKTAADLLKDENFETAKLTLVQQGKIPEDATAIIVAGATVDFLPQETELVSNYLKAGGKVLLLIDPPEKGGAVQPTSLIALAKSWGIQVNDDVIVDPQGQLVGADASVPVGMPSQHAITKGFRIISAFPLARSVTPVEGGAEGKFAQSVVESGKDSWSEADVKGLYETRRPEKDLNKGDKAGPISVGAAVSAPAAAAPTPTPAPTPGAPPAPEPPKPESRLVVFGDSDFASNRWIRQLGNGDLFLNTANWLAQQEDLISIRPRDPEDHRIEITQGQQTAVLIFGLAVIPLLLFGNAVRIYRKRR